MSGVTCEDGSELQGSALDAERLLLPLLLGGRSRTLSWALRGFLTWAWGACGIRFLCPELGLLSVVTSLPRGSHMCLVVNTWGRRHSGSEWRETKPGVSGAVNSKRDSGSPKAKVCIWSSGCWVRTDLGEADLCLAPLARAAPAMAEGPSGVSTAPGQRPLSP